ncbi:MAG: D-glycero-beta-D-manno-heptose-7-phosphate kinase [Myxococcales bacterium]|nr:D-glycero-beta-D-manno-heptose-7-phosphate kinase [Myxococcales bacterium]
MTLTERKKQLSAILNRFKQARVLVVGDVMADHYVWGEVERISPEAPVPVVRVRREEILLGGAANVANNLRALGARVALAGVIGDDAIGNHLRTMLQGNAIDTAALAADGKRPTIIKTRVVAQNQQVVRVDWENADALTADQRRRLLDAIAARLPELDAIIVSDYAKGVIDKGLLDGLRLLHRRRGIPVVIDPKIRNMAFYRGFTCMTPNHHEAGQALGVKIENTPAGIHAGGRRLRRKLKLDSLVITRGEGGMSLFFGDDEVVDIPTVAREVYDVTGAGDTVIAALTCGLAVGASLHDAALIANFAAGLVIAEVGTARAEAPAVQAAIRQAKALS